MIDQARSLLDQVHARIAAIDEQTQQLIWERDGLVGVRDSLTTFVEQPGQESAVSPAGSPAPASQPGSARASGAGAARPVGTPTPAPAPRTPPRVSCPDCDAEVRPGGLGTHRRLKHGHRAAPKVTEHPCPDCDDVLPTSRGLSIHRRRMHGVLGERAAEAAKAQLTVVDEHPRPDPAVFPDAPASAYVEDGVLVIGDQAWTPEQWNGRDGRAYRAQRDYKRQANRRRSADNPRSAPPLELPPRVDQAVGE